MNTAAKPISAVYKKKVTPKKVVGKTLWVLVLAAFLVFSLFPFVWMFITSIKDSKEIFTFPVQYWPSEVYWGNYIEVITEGNFFTYFINSAVMSISVAVLVAIIVAMASYVLSRMHFKFKPAVFAFFLMTQMLPAASGVAPVYQLMRRLGMIDNMLTVIIILTASNISFNVILLLGFYSSVPKEVEEAAYVDGASETTTFIKIVLPLVIPGVMTVMIMTFLAAWNDVVTSVLYINSRDKMTLPVAIYSMIGKYNIAWGSLSASTLMAMLPAVVLFAFLKNFFVENLAAGAVKG